MADTTIKIKRGLTAGVVPSGLTYGELAVNVTDAILYVGGTTGETIQIVGGGGGSGATGATGSQGNTGATGATGSQGATGATGATGSQGIQGNTGATGATGSQGIQGNTGATGATGPQGIQGNTGAGGALGYWGSFWSTQDQVAAGTTLAYPITYNNTDPNSNGVSIVSNSQITFSHAGVYNIEFSAQADRVSGSGTDTIDIWFRKNGTDVPDSNTIVTVSGSALAAKTVAAWNYMLQVSANDYVELMWRTSDTRLELIADPAGTSPTRPAIPSVILTAHQVMYTQLGPTGATGAIGATGSQGATGATGATGSQGIQGNTGATGAIPTDYVTSVNGATGAVTNVAKTNIAQTFTQLQSFSAGISASGATFSSGSTIKFNGSGNLTSISNLNIGDAFNTTSIGDYNGDGNSTYIFVNDGSNQLFLSNPSDSVIVSGNVDLTTGTLILPNDEYIQNSTNGRVDIMPAPTSASAYGMYIDTTTWTYGVKLGTVRSSDGTLNAGSFLYDTNCNISDGKDFTFGASSYYTLSQRSSGGQQCLSIGLLTGDQNSSSSGSLVLVQNNQRTSSNRIPTTDHAHPTLYIYAGGSTANDYVRINHDTSNATIATGDGSIILDPANSVVVIDGGLTASNLYVTSGATFDSTIAATSTTNTVDIIASTDGAGLRIAQAASGGASRVGGIRLGRSGTTATNTYLENNIGVFTIYNGVDNTGTNLFSISNIEANFGVNVFAPNIVNSVNGKTGAIGITAGTNVTITQSGNTLTVSSRVPDFVLMAMGII